MSINKRSGRIQCDNCQRFISWKDVEYEFALHELITPDSEHSDEEYSSMCVACWSPVEYIKRLGYEIDEETEKKVMRRQKQRRDDYYAES